MGWRVPESPALIRELNDMSLRFRRSHALFQGRIPASHMKQERFTGYVRPKSNAGEAESPKALRDARATADSTTALTASRGRSPRTCSGARDPPEGRYC
jgi:hypothetical protein